MLVQRHAAPPENRGATGMRACLESYWQSDFVLAISADRGAHGRWLTLVLPKAHPVGEGTQLSKQRQHKRVSKLHLQGRQLALGMSFPRTHEPPR